MSIEKKLLIALILALVFSPAGYTQHFKPPKKNTAELQKTKATMQEMALNMARKQSSYWQDISSAPSFPLPLYKGNQTKFFKPSAGATALLENSHNRTITMITQDPAATVYQYYQRELPTAGFVLDRKFPSQVGKAGIFVLKGDSAKSCASVTITPKVTPTSMAAQITISVFDIPVAPVKK
ncbi:MAG: hypothetical protein K2X81_00500 [Candidatus Obscuribacterales bacterium]|nr:hypothetical protein [Candidatus Obscuribacterales bacterium]